MNLKKYDPDEEVTVWFVVGSNPGGDYIQAWSDNKDLAKIYMEFHNCKSYHLKKRTDTLERIVEILNENTNDEISIYNVYTRGKHQMKLVQLPLTMVEYTHIQDEAAVFMPTKIDYAFLNDCLFLFKKRWKQALDGVMLTDVLRFVIHNQRSSIIDGLGIDEVKLLVREFPDNFGM